jgi:ribonuclease HII
LTKIILGIDEVGRGSLAGPLYAAAVILKSPILGLKDSKLLSRKQRENLFKLIINRATFVGIGYAEAAYIDEFGLTRANAYAMEQAIKGLNIRYDEIIIDGNYNYLDKIPNVKTVIKADQTYPTVGAASIIAKVTRDKLMYEFDNKYPGYGFSTNVGYGTKAHYLAIKNLGVTPILVYMSVQKMAKSVAQKNLCIVLKIYYYYRL